MTTSQLDQEYLDRRDDLGPGSAIKWTVTVHPRLKAGIKILAARAGTTFQAYIERLLIEAIYPEEWTTMLKRLERARQNAGTPKAGKDLK